MGTELVVKADLEAAIEEIMDVGTSDVALSREEVLSLVVKFYGAVIRATQYMVITPEEAYHLDVWLTGLLEL